MSSPDQRMINEVRNNLHQIFDKRIDKEIIDLVFQHSGFKENVAFDNLQSMVEDFTETVPAQEPDPDPGPISLFGAIAYAGALGAPASPASLIGVSDTTYNATNIDEMTDAAMVLSIPYSSMEKKKEDPFDILDQTKTPPRKPVNLLEQLSSPPPPNDMNMVMSANSSMNQDPAIIQAGPSSPARPYSLFPSSSSAHNSPTPVPIPRPRPASSYSPSVTDSLFTSNPYLSAPIYQEAPPPATEPLEPYSLFMQPIPDGQVRRKDDRLSTEKQIEYINFPTRRILILMRGLPGSGKSFRARQLCGAKGVILSTDDFFKRNAEGRYHFDPRFLHDAHMWNQDRARKSIESGITPIFIDNTNMQKWEMKPYIALAIKKNYEVKIIEPDTPWAWKAGELARRNSHHVPKSKIDNMMDRYDRFECLEDILNSKKDGKNPTPKSPPRGQAAAAGSRPSPNKVPANNNNNHARGAISPIRKKTNSDQRHSERSLIDLDMELPSSSSSHPASTPLVNNNDASTIRYGESSPKNLFDIDPIGNSTLVDVSHSMQINNGENNSDTNLLRIDVPDQERTFKNIGNEIDFNLLSINKDNDEGTISRETPEELGYLSPPVVRSRSNLRIDLISPSTDTRNVTPVYEVLSDTSEDLANDIKTILGVEKSVQSVVSISSTGEEGNLENDVTLDDKESTVIMNENESPGKIAELCKPKRASIDKSNEPYIVSSQDSGPSNRNTIDLTEEMNSGDETSGARASGGLGQKEQFDLNLQFIYECFPDLKQSYCQDWLKRYNGDLVKTCDYLSRLSQVEELPDDPDDPDVEEVQPGIHSTTNQNEGFKDISDFTTASSSLIYKNDVSHIADSTPALIRDHEPRAHSSGGALPVEITDTTLKKHVETQTEGVGVEPEVLGEAFYCDVTGSSTQAAATKRDSFTIAIDTKLAKEMMKMYGEGNDEDQLRPEDLMLHLDNNMGKILFDVWMGSIKAKKRKANTMLEDDERYAKELQEEEDAANATGTEAMAAGAAAAAGATTGGVTIDLTKKKKAKKDNKKDTPFSSENDPRIYCGSFEPNHTWKETETAVVSLHGKEKLSGRQLSLRKQLHKMFPGVDEDACNDILAAASYDMSSAETMIRNSCGLVKNQVIQNVFAGDVDGAEWSKVLSPPRKKVHTNPHNSPASPNNNINARILSPRIDNTLYQTMSEHNQSYQDFRAEAEVHKNLRTEYFQKAAVAFQQKQGQVSQYYADKAREHTLKMNEAHGRAAELTLERKNREYMKEGRVIDFHGLHSDEALRALTNFLSNAIRLKHKSIQIITGRGNHSKGSFSTVRNKVIKALNAHGYQYRLHNGGGMVEVFMKV